MQLVTKKGQLAVEKPKPFNPEAQSQGPIAFAVVKQRTELASLKLVMDYELDGKTYRAGKDSVLVSGESALEPWAQNALTAMGKAFVLCPEAKVIGFVVGE